MTCGPHSLPILTSGQEGISNDGTAAVYDSMLLRAYSDSVYPTAVPVDQDSGPPDDQRAQDGNFADGASTHGAGWHDHAHNAASQYGVSKPGVASAASISSGSGTCDIYFQVFICQNIIINPTIPYKQFFCRILQGLILVSHFMGDAFRRTVARLSTCGITVIVEFREEGCLKYPGTAERVHEGLMDVFEKTVWKILTLHRGWERCGQRDHQNHDEGYKRMRGCRTFARGIDM
ncbi:hypothetical protein B0H14DRAFT_2581176 [Mycena olivaceomarginata]|nr:hypothetical protein B0H14DRAFT_2581176 [Mycena olivaceomarginata]